MAYTNLKDALQAFENQVVKQIHPSKADLQAEQIRVNNKFVEVKAAYENYANYTATYTQTVLESELDSTKAELLAKINNIQGVEKIVCSTPNNTPLGVEFYPSESSGGAKVTGTLTAANAKQNGMYFVLLDASKRASFKKYEIYLPINGNWEKLAGTTSGGGTASISITDAELQAIQRETA